LKPEANPTKGTPRTFSAGDLRVLAYVYMHWEEQPDYESIKIGLNTESHFEQQYNDFLTMTTPLFQESPEGLDGTWRHGTVIGGMSEIGDMFALAESYKLAGDMLVDGARAADEINEVIYPIIYNYRHATELYLKAVVTPYKENHDLSWLVQEFEKLLKSEFDSTLPPWFESVILAFNDFDPKSTTFRYGGFSSFSQGEVWVDLVHVKTLMGWIAQSFRKIRHRRGAS
jgi:hypothetical protein